MKSIYMPEDNGFHIIPKEESPKSLDDLENFDIYPPFCGIGFDSEAEAWVNFREVGWITRRLPMRAVFLEDSQMIHLIPFDKKATCLEEVRVLGTYGAIGCLDGKEESAWAYAFESLWVISNYCDIIVYSSKEQGDHTGHEFFKLANCDKQRAFQVFKSCLQSNGDTPSSVIGKLVE